ncbi:hypothetical protein BX666DRAFT_1539856 [Dichotomocladium elegans]|nr:hypothetical protein BX666DRAFT_1539856 [Dichotomocladium elegans]
MSYSEYTQENDYIHPSRAPEGSLHAPTPPKHPPETHSDRTFGINNQSPFSALFAPDQTYMMTTPDTWATAGGETSRFPTASGVQYDPLTFHIPRTPSSSHEAARLLPTAAGHHELFQTATVQLPTSRPLSIENGSWLDKKNGAHDGREKILPQPNDSYQPTALLPTPPVSTQTLMTQGEVREWNVEPQVHWRQPDILTSADHYSLSGYNDRSNTRTRKRRASANTSDATANIPEATNVASTTIGLNSNWAFRSC